jgi:hypothetical protein
MVKPKHRAISYPAEKGLDSPDMRVYDFVNRSLGGAVSLDDSYPNSIGLFSFIIKEIRIVDNTNCSSEK